MGIAVDVCNEVKLDREFQIRIESIIVIQLTMDKNSCLKNNKKM